MAVTVILSSTKKISTPKARANVKGVNKTLRFSLKPDWRYGSPPLYRIFDKRAKRFVADTSGKQKGTELVKLLNAA